VTDIKWNANHAKFYPDGQRLVATLLQKPGGERRGIVMLDVGEFVSEAQQALGGQRRRSPVARLLVRTLSRQSRNQRGDSIVRRCQSYREPDDRVAHGVL
jgi:hypothetical protein